MKVGIYKSRARTERNKGFVVIYNFDKDWEEGVLKNRALLGNRVFVRDAFPHEEECVEKNWRAVSYKYVDIEGLIADERRAGCDERTLTVIREACK
jgi:hypothetical protein